MPETKPPRITRAYLQSYFDLEERRKALSREASDIKKLQDEIEERLLDHVRAKGGKARALVTAGYRLAIVNKNGSVSWKAEYIKIAGQVAAETLTASAEPKEELEIEKA